MPFGSQWHKEASAGNGKDASIVRRRSRKVRSERVNAVSRAIDFPNSLLQSEVDTVKHQIEKKPLEVSVEWRRTPAGLSATEFLIIEPDQREKTEHKKSAQTYRNERRKLPASVTNSMQYDYQVLEDKKKDQGISQRRYSGREFDNCENKDQNSVQVQRGRRRRVPTQGTKSVYKLKESENSRVSQLQGQRQSVRPTLPYECTRSTERKELVECTSTSLPETDKDVISYRLPSAKLSESKEQKQTNDHVVNKGSLCKIEASSLPVLLERRPSTRNKEEESFKTARECDTITIQKGFEMLYSEVCRLSRNDIKEKSNFVNNVVENQIIAKVYEMDERFTFEILHAGSYYEKLKVKLADEFDIMVKMNAEKISNLFQIRVWPVRRQYSQHLTGFAHLEYQSHYDKDGKWQDLLMERPDTQPTRLVLSPQKLLNHFKHLLCLRSRAIAPRFPEIEFFELNLQGPAVTLSFRLSGGKQLDIDVVLCIETEWPSVAQNWGVLSVEGRKWPSSKTIDDIKKKGCHVVPKVNSKDPRCWRLSFSLAEKTLLSPKGIEEDKKCYRIMKYIFEFHKHFLYPLCSYHLKTLFLLLRSSGHLQSKISKKENGIQDVLVFLIQELMAKVKKKELQHFFIGHNLNLFRDLTDEDVTGINSCLSRILSKFSETSSLCRLIRELRRESYCHGL